jgi:hypothetical protein
MPGIRRVPWRALVTATSNVSPPNDDHDLHLRLLGDEWAAVQAVAARVRMPVSAAVRLLVLRGLDREEEDPSPPRRGGRRLVSEGRIGDREVAIATLVATEHTQLLLQDMAPGGAERAARLEEQAGAAAQRRLERIAAAVKGGRG